MLTHELAELAGVTPRTLRHYHQIGLLPEPPRSAGGYRNYGVDHLVLLLRITRMSALGLPLSALPALLEDEAAAEELLEELDRRTAEDIARLTARRADIAALRRSGTPPDLPPQLGASLPAPAAGTPADVARYEHDQIVLLAHLLGADGPSGFAALFGADEGTAPPAPLTARFYALGPRTPEEEVASLIEALVAHLAPVMARLTGLSALDARASALMDELNELSLDPVQHRVLRRVQQRLARPDQ